MVVNFAERATPFGFLTSARVENFSKKIYKNWTKRIWNLTNEKKDTIHMNALINLMLLHALLRCLIKKYDLVL